MVVVGVSCVARKGSAAAHAAAKSAVHDQASTAKSVMAARIGRRRGKQRRRQSTAVVPIRMANAFPGIRRRLFRIVLAFHGRFSGSRVGVLDCVAGAMIVRLGANSRQRQFVLRSPIHCIIQGEGAVLRCINSN
jgi:hypothetical protein